MWIICMMIKERKKGSTSYQTNQRLQNHLDALTREKIPEALLLIAKDKRQ